MSSLRSKLSKDFLLENGVSGLEAKFDEIAEILLTKTKIKKGALSYDILDIEFYLFCKVFSKITQKQQAELFSTCYFLS